MPKARIIRLIAGIAAVIVLGMLFRASIRQRSAAPPDRGNAASRSPHVASHVATRVRLDGLDQQRFSVGEWDRDPFSFKARAAALRVPSPPAAHHVIATPIRETSPNPPPLAAPFRFMGVLQKGSGGTWAVFADCTGYTRAAREGESVLGVWRVLRIGVESVAIESLDGQRVVMAQGGCAAR
jgi:hypothetical protein